MIIPILPEIDEGLRGTHSSNPLFSRVSCHFASTALTITLRYPSIYVEFISTGDQCVDTTEHAM